MVSVDTRQDVELVEVIPDEPFDKRGVKPCVSRDILISCRITAERGAASSGNHCVLACEKGPNALKGGLERVDCS